MPGCPSRFKRAALAGLAVVALLAGACGGGDDDDDAASSKAADAPRAQTYGRAAEAAEATRTIELKMTDELKFEPASIDVKKGEIVTFKVTNTGAQAHEMTIGGPVSQELHEAQMLAMDGSMAGMDNMGDMKGMDHSKMKHGEGIPTMEEIDKLDKKSPAFKSVHIEPGQTGEITWAFEGEAPIFGCHLPGHYNAGMKGAVVYT